MQALECIVDVKKVIGFQSQLALALCLISSMCTRSHRSGKI
ncbi:hypothetical protein HanHA300_Chr15g0573441 [Helianthus annuus]|nr:hypothetical protein HanHA300_Chr15g0573441 [Helianthus annuus]KAJ0473836.1 hypothetical protein HanHA89_Chr15g0622901 [Helianthus annuus]KAJ0649412.1 hypothetical protein HanLR1_Chr15g0583991 [Helianthus annuus]